MTATATTNGVKPPDQTKTIDDLFGLADDTNDDPFNEFGNDAPVERALDVSVGSTIPAAEDVVPEQPTEDDPFAGIGEVAAEEQQEAGDADEPEVEVDEAELARQKAYDDLLAEFDDDVLPELGDAGFTSGGQVEDQSLQQQGEAAHALPKSGSPPPPIQALFSEDDSAFDDFLGITADDLPPTPELRTVPNSLVENSPTHQHPGDTSVHSLFSNTSDWLDDTTVDDSFIDERDGEASRVSELLPRSHDTSGAGPALEEEDVEVPEGWIDEYGNFEYYTPEDKEAVRQTMLAERAATRARAPAVDLPPPTPFISENAARRTPQPDHPVQRIEPPSQLPYAPPVFSRHSTGLPTPQTQPSNAYSPALVNAYSPAPSTQSSYFPPSQPAGHVAPYDPYAPQLNAPTMQNIPPISQAGSAAKPVPPKPQRVVSNAYDPPFLRPQKSFIRPATAGPISTPSFPPSMPVRGTPPASAPAPLPPTGPPRRTPSVPPPSSLGLSRLGSTVPENPSQQSTYDPNGYSLASAPPPGSYNAPPSRPTSQASQRKQPIPNAFDPPLRPPSVSRPLSRSAFTSTPPVPPISLPPPPPPAGPSRPSSRGGQKRGTPLFEAPPPLPHKRAPPTFAPEDRHQQPVMPPPRAPTPERRPAKSGVPRDVGWPHLSDASEDDEMGQFEPEVVARQSGKLEMEEEQDPEDGQWREDEDEGDASRQMDFEEEDRYSAPPIPQAHSAPPIQQPVRPQPPPIARQASYDPYAPSTSGPSSVQSQGSYAPSAREPISPSTPTQEYHTFGNYTSPPKVRPPIPTSFAPPAAQDPYAPSSSTYQTPKPASAGYEPHRPAAISIPIQPPTPYMPSSDPYAPSEPGSSNTYAPHVATSPIRATNLYAPTEAGPSNPYAPNRATSPSQTTSLYAPNRANSPAQSHLSASPQDNNYFQSMHMDTSYVPQQVLEQRPVSEDPLGRCTLSAKNAPLAIFGFGGVLVTAFPGSAEDPGMMGHNRTPSYGYASGRGQMLIRPLGTVMETSLGKANDSPYPGPLLLDPLHPKGSAGEKKKKEGVLAYLDARADEIERALPYLRSNASPALREEEGKLLMVRLLSALVIGDGKFTGSSKVEEAMKKALANPSESHPLITPGILNSSAYPSQAAPAAKSRPLSAPGQLSSLSALLVSGDKRDAIEYAASHGSWSHALAIASSLGPEVWKEIMSRFIKEEVTNEGLSGLKASYLLFAGSDASIVEELYNAANITSDPSKDAWREVIASIVFNGRSADLACLDELAGKFSQRGLNNVAHACSLLSPSSPFIDPAPTAFDRPIGMLQNSRNGDAILFAEVAEYARGLIAVPKGLEVPFPGLPSLLPYKLQRAWQAAEQGDVDLAKRYCNSIEAASKLAKTGPSLLLPHFVSSLEDLLERLTGSPSIEPAKGLSARKQTAKPGLDKLGSWIGGRITTFIAGDDETSSTTFAPKVAPTAKGSAPVGIVGPFSHFSTISPAPSTDVSRNGSLNDIAGNNSFGNSMANGNGYLGVGGRSGTASYGMPSPQTETPPTLAAGGYSAWGSEAVDDGGNDDDTPLADDGAAELLTPMAAMTFGNPSDGPTSYTPKRVEKEEEDDEDDLGFGNAGLSRDRTPRPVENDDTAKPSTTASSKKPAETKPGKDEGSLSKDEAKPAGWFKGWWGKKDGDAAGPGPIRAKLGDENAMVFDKELRRWVVKGQKPEAAPAAPPPPPRSQTVSPGRSARPPISTNGSSGPPPAPFGTMPRSVSGSAAPPSLNSELSRRAGPPQPRSGLAESVTAEQAPPAAAALSAPKPPPMVNGGPPGPPGLGRPPGGPPGMPKPPQGASIDDLLSRPPSKRPASAASRKGAKNRYVDVFQQPAEK